MGLYKYTNKGEKHITRITMGLLLVISKIAIP